MDFERRRQFGKALSIYQRIAQAIPGFRDIQERSGKLSVMPECFASPATATAASVSSGSATIIIDDLIIPRPIIGRYQIERELGRGAMGMVYLGHDPKISRTVAIKTMALADEFDEGHLDEVKRRFYQEAETAGQLNHPNIVTIYDVGEEHDLAYIAMDYIDGKSLDFYTKTDSLLSIEEVFDIGIHIADALSYAHDRKVVHRDVKPANIMYDNKGHVLKVMDFGIACLTDNSKTRTGSVLGSPFYMSPEQIAGKRVDGRSDLYSLGVTLYQLFTGHLPFAGDSMAALMYQIANEKAASIRKIRDELPVCLVRIINQAMEKDISKRYQSGHLMADALFSCAERQGLTASLRARR
jgi:serine/threonine-protein kinase